MVDRLPEFQGPKYAGSFRRGDFADFHQRFSLVTPGGSGWMVDLHELEPLDLPQRAAHPR